MKVIDQYHQENFSLYHGDSVEIWKGLPTNSIGLTLTSIPFSSIYLYSPSPRDMGNTDGDDHFFENFDFLIPELWRTTMPGRLCAVHCKDLPLYMGSDGQAGLRDFPSEVSRRFTGRDVERIMAKIEAIHEVSHLVQDKTPLIDRITDYERELVRVQSKNWTYHSRVTIWKCPKIERDRTYNHGLLHNQLCKDSSVSRQGMADYLLVFRKWDDGMDGLHSIQPVRRDEEWRFDEYIGLEPPLVNFESNARDFSIQTWRKYASPVWFDINQTKVLNSQIARKNGEAHLCLATGSLILSKEGYKPIESIEIGDLVLTHKGRWMPVIAKQCTGVNPVLQVKAQGVPNLLLTPTHKIWTRLAKGGHERQYAIASSPEWVEAERTKGSYVNLQLPPVVEHSEYSAYEWKIIGRWLADGHISKRKTIHISCGSHKLENLLLMLGDKAGSVFNREACPQVLVKDSGGRLRKILKQCGHGAANKHLPPEAFSLSSDLARALLDGYLSGDGHYVESRKKWMASSVSRELLLGLALLVQRAFGVVASVYAGRPAGETTIEGRKVNTLQDWILCFNEEKDTSPFIDSDGAWKKVRSVDMIGTAETWSLRVAEDASYTAENCVVKNCPLQFDVIDRAIDLWTNPGDVVADPFSGVGSTGYRALPRDRRYVGGELKREYWQQSCGFLDEVTQVNQLSLLGV